MHILISNKNKHGDLTFNISNSNLSGKQNEKLSKTANPFLCEEFFPDIH